MWPRMFMGCIPKSVVVAFQVVILIYTSSMELEFPISHHLGVLRLLDFCQPLKQYLKPVLIFVFMSLMPRCFHVYWLFGVSLLWFACLLPLSTALSGYLPFVVILVLILLQLLALQISYPACLFTLCFLCLLCFQKSLPTSKNHKNGLTFFPSSF